MAGKKKAIEAVASAGVVRYGGAEVRWYLRKNEMFSLAWREDGVDRRTTRASREKALEFADRKTRELSKSTGNHWISPARRERLEWLERLAGGAEEAGRLLMDLEAARGLIGPVARLEEAAKWFVAHGPPAVGKMTLAAAVEGFLAEYEKHHSSMTLRGIKIDLHPLARAQGDVDLLEVTPQMLEAQILHGKVHARTVRNRIASWVTFFNRCRELGWWPDGRRNPASVLKRPPKVEKLPEVFSPEEGKAGLLLVARSIPQHFPYFLIAGWLGCRPTECTRLRWDDFDWKAGLLCVRPEVAKKVRRARWVPVPRTLAVMLRLFRRRRRHGKAAAGLVCRKNSREFVSKLLREKKVVASWPPDVLRHSFITYRLQIVRNIDQVADEAGNSPKEIRNSYRRPIPPGVGEAWFAVLEEVRQKRGRQKTEEKREMN